MPNACPRPTATRTRRRRPPGQPAGRARLGPPPRAAAPWVDAVRRHPPPFWAMETLLREYPISGSEGLALMRLAEALLRVPDAETAIALTADQLGAPTSSGTAATARWRACPARPSACPRRCCPATARPRTRACWGGWARAPWSAPRCARCSCSATSSCWARTSPVRSTPRRRPGARRNVRFSFDMLGEGARTADDAQRYLQSYRDAIARDRRRRRCRRPGGAQRRHLDQAQRAAPALRVRCSANACWPTWCRACGRCASRPRAPTSTSPSTPRRSTGWSCRWTSSRRWRGRSRRSHPRWRGFGLALQAYQSRAVDLVEHVAQLARTLGLRFMCRLVKGAYWDAEIKRAQELGLPHYPVFTHKHHTDISYLACARALLQAHEVIYPQFATHNAGTIAAIVQMARHTAPSSNCSACTAWARASTARCCATRRSPAASTRRWAATATCWPTWCGGCWRTAPTRPSCTSWPIRRWGWTRCCTRRCTHRPRRRCRCPRRCTAPGRRNSEGVDLAVDAMRAAAGAGAGRRARCPRVPTEPAAVAPALQRAVRAFPGWDAHAGRRARRLPAPRRRRDAAAAAPVRAAGARSRQDLGRCRVRGARGDRLPALLRGAGRDAAAPQTLPGPTGESNTLRLCGRGAWVCISPWNFPLAIFTGQVAAALVTGNTVLAKPAEQTPAIARRSRRAAACGRRAADALQLLPGDRRDGRRRAGRRAGHRGRGVHRLDRGRARHRPGARRQGRPDRAADRRDRRHQRDGGGLDRAARAGGRRRGAERLPLGRPALLGAAAAVRARSDRRRGDRDGGGAARELVCGDPACWPPTSAR
jgi:RHH-type proline utilization regulon transcriptional repressor/proline dehydrogenase/delta 1-pyrroline-5-carboxylate dehydrogenase